MKQRKIISVIMIMTFLTLTIAVNATTSIVGNLYVQKQSNIQVKARKRPLQP
jgi:hypothetical protein